MSYPKPIAVILAAVVCATVFAADADAQSRGRSGGGRAGGGRSGSRGPSIGRAVPRSGGVRVDRGRSVGGFYNRGRTYGSRVFVSPRVGVRGPLRSFYYPYYGYGTGLSIGLYGRRGYGYYGYYGYPYAYGYPYGAYGYSYGGYYPAGYGYGYGYGRYGYGYRDSAYGGVRIQGAVRDAEVYVDGYYAGIVDDFDGAFQRLELEPGAHEIEIRAPGFPPLAYDVNVQPGQTVNLHAR